MSSPRFLVGASWSTLSTISSVIFPFLLFMLFARVASPNQIGLFAYALAWIEMLKALAPQGVYEAFMGRPPEGDSKVAGMMLTVLGLSGVCGFAIYIPLIALTTQHTRPELWALVAVGLRIPFDLVALQPQAMIAKRQDFGRMALRTLVGNSVSAVIGAALALTGSPLLGMAAYYVSQSALVFLMTVTAKGVLIPPALTMDRVREGWRELGGQPISASWVRTIAAANNYLDQIVVAGFVPIRALANFNLGKRVETMLIQGSSTFSVILFQPVLAGTTGAVAERRLTNSLLTLAVLCGIPVAVLVTNSDSVVKVVFGARWLAAAPAVALLAVSGLARAIGTVHGSYLSVNARNRQLLAYAAPSSVLGIAAVAGLGGFGITACAAGLAVKSVVMTGWVAWITRDILPLRRWLFAVILPIVLLFAGAELGALVSRLIAPAAGGLLATGLSWASSLAFCLLAAIAALHRPILERYSIWRQRSV